MSSTGNRLLDALAPEDQGQIRPHLTEVELPLKLELFSSGNGGGFCYFPTTAVVSLMKGFENGTQVEVAVVGWEGFAGLHGILGDDLEPSTGVVQYSGKVLRIEEEVLREIFWERVGSFQKVSLRFVYALISQISQTAACNQLHLVDQRLARWLLSMWDRASSDELELSHEFLAQMLGVTRPRVTQSMKKLTEAGAIESRRNSVRLLDHPSLCHVACECYDEALRAYGPLLAGRPLKAAAKTA